MITDVDVTLHGPIFDNVVWDAAMDHFMRDATMDVADEGGRDVRVNLSQVLQQHTTHFSACAARQISADLSQHTRYRRLRNYLGSRRHS